MLQRKLEVVLLVALLAMEALRPQCRGLLREQHAHENHRRQEGDAEHSHSHDWCHAGITQFKNWTIREEGPRLATFTARRRQRGGRRDDAACGSVSQCCMVGHGPLPDAQGGSCSSTVSHAQVAASAPRTGGGRHAALLPGVPHPVL